MDENRKNAYRHLLYYFLIEIRTIPTPNQPELSLEQLKKRSYYAGAVAYHLHNFALAAASDFTEFCEESFWSGLRRFSVNNPTIDLSHYRGIFDQQLAPSNT
ncbi:hypothetical protein [Hymenobacter pini]|uniref:hypothetical protein n=1 Tax=Hymenobacter pini TaxID=2880879 RepID=UPI001CF512F7|nr:hypothetical protein [Hymenobacter pini]MCA8831635.1 hypothetical protein [Hymenobacter pini]